MNMVFNTTDFKRDAVQTFNDTTEILEYLRKVIFMHIHARCFHMENEMDIYFHQ